MSWLLSCIVTHLYYFIYGMYSKHYEFLSTPLNPTAHHRRINLPSLFVTFFLQWWWPGSQKIINCGVWPPPITCSTTTKECVLTNGVRYCKMETKLSDTKEGCAKWLRESTLLHTQVYKRTWINGHCSIACSCGNGRHPRCHHCVGKGKCNRYKMWAMVQETRHTATWVDPSPQCWMKN